MRTIPPQALAPVQPSSLGAWRGLGWLIFFACLWLSQKVTLGAEAESYQLEARPNICITQLQDEPCRMGLALSWQGPPRARICLRNATLGERLQCWENQGHGSLEVAYSSTGNMVYELLVPDPQQVLTHLEIQVVSRDLRNTRHRRRHIWSIL